jgi:hypothetical protein
MHISSTPRLCFLRRAAVAAAAALFACAPVFAETFTWSNVNTGNSNWSAASSWIGGTVPVSANTTDILFATSPRTSPLHDLSNPFTVRSLWFYDNPYTLSGNGLTFDGASAAIYNYTTTSISNSITLNSTISYEGTGNLTFTNAISGPGGFIKNGAGTVNFNFFTLYTGATDINAGQISLGHFQGLLSTTVNLNTNNGLNLNGFSAVIGNLAGSGNLNLGAASIGVGSNNTSQTYSGQFSGAGSVEKRGTGTWTLTGAGSNFPRFSVSNGRVILSGGSLTLTLTGSGVGRALTVGNIGIGTLDVFAGAVLNTLAGGAGNALIRSTASGRRRIALGRLANRHRRRRHHSRGGHCR